MERILTEIAQRKTENMSIKSALKTLLPGADDIARLEVKRDAANAGLEAARRVLRRAAFEADGDQNAPAVVQATKALTAAETRATLALEALAGAKEEQEDAAATAAWKATEELRMKRADAHAALVRAAEGINPAAAKLADKMKAFHDAKEAFGALDTGRGYELASLEQWAMAHVRNALGIDHHTSEALTESLSKWLDRMPVL